jgi:hypothetical protein
MWKSTISMAIFNSYVSLPEGNVIGYPINKISHQLCPYNIPCICQPYNGHVIRLIKPIITPGAAL